MPVVDAVVDDRDLHSLAGGRRPRAPERGRADRRQAAVELRPVDRAPVHGCDAVDLLQSADRLGGDNDRKRVRDDPIAPADTRPGRRLRSGRPPAPARPGPRQPTQRRARVESRPTLRAGSCERAADGDESSTTTCTMRPSETGARPNAAPRQARAAPPRARPRRTARLRRGIVRTRRQEFGSPAVRCISERRISAQGLRL